MMMSPLTDGWISLIIAIVFGVLGTFAMKLSHGLQHVKPTLLLIIFYLISFIALTFAMNHIELSIVYAVWSGVGTLLMAAIGVLHFHESLSLKKIIFLILIIIGVIGVHV